MKNDGFLDKFIKRLNKIDQTSLEKYVLRLTEEKEFAYKILDTITEGIIIINTQGIATFCNNAAKDILMRSVSEANISIRNIFVDDDLFKFIQKNYENSTRVINEHIEVLKPRQMHLRISLIPIYKDEKQDMHTFLIVIHNMNIERQFELKQRDEHVESLTKLAAGIAHEIGNPLNTIHIYLKLISDEVKKVKNKRINDLVKTISNETLRLDKMVKNFLDVMRGRIALFKRGDINICIEKAMHFLSPEIKKLNIEHVITLDKTIPLFFIDIEKMYLVFLNIFKNAIEAMKEGGRLEIKSSINGNLVTVMCHDTGVGIHEDDLPHIFDAYFTKKQGGSGLGLMNVFNIIKAHGGRIHVQSEEGKGTMVIITLPLRRGKLQLTHVQTSKMYNSGN